MAEEEAAAEGAVVAGRRAPAEVEAEAAEAAEGAEAAQRGREAHAG